MENIRENVFRRSVANHISAKRHNKRQDEMLEKTFSLYQQQIQLTDLRTYFAERRLGQHARNALGLAVRYRCKTLEPSINREFYYKSTSENCTIKEFSVEPLCRVLQQKNMYEMLFERRCKEYTKELRQEKCAEDVRKEKLMYTTANHLRNDFDRSIDWRTSEDSRVRLPSIHNSRKYLSNTHFSFDL